MGGWSRRAEGGGEWLFSCHRKAEPPSVNTFSLNQQVGQHPGCSGVPRGDRAAAPSPLLLPQQKPPLIPCLLVQQVCNTSTTDIHPFPSPSSSWEYSGFTASGERAAREILLVMSRWDCAYSHQPGKNQRKPNLLSFSKGLRAPHHHSAAHSVCCRRVAAPGGKPCTQTTPELHGNQAQQPRHTQKAAASTGEKRAPTHFLLCWDTPLLLKQRETPGSAPGTRLQRQRGAG